MQARLPVISPSGDRLERTLPRRPPRPSTPPSPLTLTSPPTRPSTPTPSTPSSRRCSPNILVPRRPRHLHRQFPRIKTPPIRRRPYNLTPILTRRNFINRLFMKHRPHHRVLTHHYPCHLRRTPLSPPRPPPRKGRLFLGTL